MKAQKKRNFRVRVLFLVPALAMSLLYAGQMPRASYAQNPSQAESYRRLAAGKRKAAENVPAKRDCYLAWARYYDCLAGKYETGDNRDCGKEPPAC